VKLNQVASRFVYLFTLEIQESILKLTLVYN